MTLKFKADKLLHSISANDCFMNRLEPDDRTKERMASIKKLIRGTIRTAFNEAHQIVETSGIAALNQRFALSFEDFSPEESGRENAFQEFKKVKPKFRSQGSSVYGTLNTPAQPPQQMDVDDGVYLPMSIFEEQSPVIGKEVFFKIVDTALNELCRLHGWNFERKNTCARIVVNDLLHFDVPLYAIPDGQYKEFAESMESVAALNMKAEDQQVEIVLDPNQVYLATRDSNHWKPSDPKQVLDWFQGEVKTHEVYLKRMCRYLKAWRDNTWADGAISSIALMACVVKTFNMRQYAAGFNSQSEALLAVVDNLPQQLREKVKLPVNDETLFPRAGDVSREKEVIDAAERLRVTIRNSLLSAQTKQDCVNGFISAFGVRVPNKADYVEIATGHVRQTPPQKQSSPNKEMQPNFRAG